MLFDFYLIVFAVCAPGIYYLMMTPMEKDEFFLTRWLAGRLYPRLDRRQRQQRLQFLAGLVVAVFACAAIITFFINFLSRR